MMLDRSTPPMVHDAIEFDYVLPQINTYELKNGLSVYWLNAGVQDVVEINWVFPAGLWYELKPAVAQATAALLRNGTRELTARQVHEALEFYGADLKVNAGNDFATVTLHSLTKHLPNLLPVIYQLITGAIFPEEELAIYKHNTIQKLLVNLRQCEFVANQRIDALLFGEFHPYGRYSRREKIEAVTREDILAFYKDHFNLLNAKIFMAGRLSEADVALLNDTFGAATLAPSNISQEMFSAPAPSPVKQRVDNDPNGVQGAIRIGRLFPNRHHPDYAPMVVLNNLFGGYFGSRLMSNIREEKGYTYGIHSSMVPYMYGGSLIVSTEANKDVLGSAIDEVYKEMELLTREPASEEELLLVKNYLLGGILGDLDGPFSILQRWRTLILNGFTEEHFNNNVRIYKTVTAEALVELAQKYFDRKDFWEVVVV
jgi:zinc protease